MARLKSPLGVRDYIYSGRPEVDPRNTAFRTPLRNIRLNAAQACLNVRPRDWLDLQRGDRTDQAHYRRRFRSELDYLEYGVVFGNAGRTVDDLLADVLKGYENQPVEACAIYEQLMEMEEVLVVTYHEQSYRFTGGDWVVFVAMIRRLALYSDEPLYHFVMFDDEHSAEQVRTITFTVGEYRTKIP